MAADKSVAVEWPTLAMLAATYAVFALGTPALYSITPALGIILTGIAVAQFSSLQHEVLHGHPFSSPVVNEVLVSPALTLTVPYRRFRDTHLAHHFDPRLTDPYDDPESYYLDPAQWHRLPRAVQRALQANNTLLGRVLIGPLIGNVMWLWGEARLIARGDRGVMIAWALHGLGFVPLLAWLHWAAMPLWAYAVAAYIGHSLLKIRTYLEHRADEQARARTVVVEDRGPLALLFLNNNLHVVHHMHPDVPWYDLPALYRARRDHFLRRNDGYRYESYAQVARRYLWRAKEPVAHPMMDVMDQGRDGRP